jgi:hypothetical protein
MKRTWPIDKDREYSDFTSYSVDMTVITKNPATLRQYNRLVNATEKLAHKIFGTKNMIGMFCGPIPRVNEVSKRLLER